MIADAVRVVLHYDNIIIGQYQYEMRDASCKLQNKNEGGMEERQVYENKCPV